MFNGWKISAWVIVDRRRRIEEYSVDRRIVFVFYSLNQFRWSMVPRIYDRSKRDRDRSQPVVSQAVSEDRF